MTPDLKDALRPLVAELVAELAKPPANDVDALTVAHYARRWSISESTVRVAIREGRLEHVRIGRSVRIPTSARIQPPSDDATTRAMQVLMGGKR